MQHQNHKGTTLIPEGGSNWAVEGTMGIPQIVAVAWFAIAVGFAIATHGRPKSGIDSMWSTLLTVGLLSALLWWGGFWGR